MGFYFRKSFGRGPFRFTFSKQGVSSSVGVRGARVTAGPRGTFVTLSSHGVYYRRRIDKPKARRRVPQEAVPPRAGQVPLDSVFQVPVSELADSNQSDLVRQLNENVSAFNPAVLLVVSSAFGLLLLSSHPELGLTLILLCALSAAVVSHRFRMSHTCEVHYSLDGAAGRRYLEVQGALASLSSCSRLWVLNSSSSTSDLKRNAGAGVLITRRPASIGKSPTKGFSASVPVTSIVANGMVFHFLPDQVLMFSGGRYYSILYVQLAVSSRRVRYVETEGTPHDSIQVDTTWRFVNKTGGPDRRFNNNHQIPVLQYAEVTLATQSGLHVILQASNPTKAEAFVSGLGGSNASAASDNKSESPRPKASKSGGRLAEAYELLGLTESATAEAAAAAYRTMASLYHPDKYEHLAPDMRALAAAKMAEINAAYDLIKASI